MSQTAEGFTFHKWAPLPRLQERLPAYEPMHALLTGHVRDLPSLRVTVLTKQHAYLILDSVHHGVIVAVRFNTRASPGLLDACGCCHGALQGVLKCMPYPFWVSAACC